MFSLVNTVILFVFILIRHQSCPAIGSRVNCNRTHYGNYDFRGVVSSYNFPFDYRHNLTCVNRIFLPPARSPQEGRQICFTFKFFSMEKNSVYCSFDRLYTWDGLVLYKYCGDGLYHYGIEVKVNSLTNVWRNNFCWPLKANTTMFNLTLFTDDSVNATGFMAFYQVHSNLTTPYHPTPTPALQHSLVSSSPHKQFAPCASDQWVCPMDRRCVHRDTLCDGVVDCVDAADESFAFARCPDRQDLIACDFSQDRDKVCGMELEGWTVTHPPHQPPFSNSWLPEVDHTNGTHGSYLHTTQLPALLKSSTTTLLPNLQYCLRFWYVIKTGKSPSSSSGDISLSVYLNEDLLRPEWLMTASSSRNRWHKRKRIKPPMDWDSAGWKLAEVVLEPSSRPLRVLFNARNGYSTSSFSSSSSSHATNAWQDGGVAIDDISILEGPCSGIDMQCNFESTTCGWHSHDGDFNFLRHTSGPGHLTSTHQWKLYDYKNSEVREDHYDKSSLDGNGNFAYVLFTPSSAASFSTDTGLLLSPPVASTYKEALCLSFWFMKSAGDACQLRVYTLSYDQRLSSPHWSDKQSVPSYLDDDAFLDDESFMEDGVEGDAFSYATEDEGNVKAWTLAQVRITSHGPFRILLEASRVESGDYCMLAVDAVRVTRSVCKHTCRPSEFRCSDGSCIDAEFRCNGVGECADASDEEDCSPVYEAPSSNDSTTCVAPSLLCNNGTFCLPEKWLCDGMVDCEDGLDELDCAYNEYKQEDIPKGGFTEQKGNEEDWTDDDGEEEDDDDDEEEECTDKDFHCLSHNECVTIEDVCDGVARCTDQSDEANCSEVVGYIPGGCPPYFNPCYQGSPCVLPSMMCDGKADCPDGSDEEKVHCASKAADQKHRSMSIVVGVVCAILLVLLLIICVVVFLLLSRRRLKRCQPRASKNQQKALKKILEDTNNNSNSNNNDDDDCSNNKHMNYKDESVSFLPDNHKDVSQASPNDNNMVFSARDFKQDLPVKTDLDFRDFAHPSPSQQRKMGVFNQASKQEGFHLAPSDPVFGVCRASTNSLGDHIYEEPSGVMSLMKQPARGYDDQMEKGDNSKHNSELRFSPSSSKFLSSIQQQQQQGVLPSVANPSATCHRISRIRLGTTALQPRVDAGGWSDNRGHATMGRPSRNQQTAFLDSRRKSGGFDDDRIVISPTSPAPTSTERFIDTSNMGTGIGRDEEMVLMMMARDASNGLIGSSKSSTPADSSNSSNSARSNTHLLPNNQSEQLFKTSNNNNVAFVPNKHKKDHRILPGIGFSSDVSQQFDLQQLPFNKHNSLFHKNLLPQKQVNSNPFNSNKSNSNNNSVYNNTTLQKQQQLQQLQQHLQQQQQHLQQIQHTLATEPDSPFVQQIYLQQHQQQQQQPPPQQATRQCGDELLNPTCV